MLYWILRNFACYINKICIWNNQRNYFWNKRWVKKGCWNLQCIKKRGKFLSSASQAEKYFPTLKEVQSAHTHVCEHFHHLFLVEAFRWVFLTSPWKVGKTCIKEIAYDYGIMWKGCFISFLKYLTHVNCHHKGANIWPFCAKWEQNLHSGFFLK